MNELDRRAFIEALGVKVNIRDEYTRAELSDILRVGCSITKQFELAASHNWYDFVVTVADDPFEQRRAGHHENGRDSFTDPAMGNPGSVPG
jgi:phospholipase C